MSDHKKLRALCDDVMDQSKRGAYQIYITTVRSIATGCFSLLDEVGHIATLEAQLKELEGELAEANVIINAGERLFCKQDV